MGLGHQGDRQNLIWINCDSMPRSKGHVFYDRLQAILLKHGFDRFVETLCASFYAESRGRRSIPPGHYFRMRLVGYFEGIDSERGIEWRCTDALSLRKFLLLNLNEVVPDHSSLSRIRSRLSLETHGQVFTFVLGQGLSKTNVSGGRFNHGSQRCTQGHRSPRYGRGLPRDVHPHGKGVGHQDSNGRRFDSAGSAAQRQKTFKQGMGVANRSRSTLPR